MLEKGYNIPERAFIHKVENDFLVVQINALVPVKEFKAKKRLSLTMSLPLTGYSYLTKEQAQDAATKACQINIKRKLQVELDNGFINIDGKEYQINKSRSGGINFDSGAATKNITDNHKPGRPKKSHESR